MFFINEFKFRSLGVWLSFVALANANSANLMASHTQPIILAGTAATETPNQYQPISLSPAPRDSAAAEPDTVRELLESPFWGLRALVR